jgi:hypothetical protein
MLGRRIEMHQKWLYRVMRGEEKKEIVAINVYQAKKLSGWFGEEGVKGGSNVY